jgi:hypothetical protein
MTKWWKENGFNDWRFWAIITFLFTVMLWTAAKKTDSHRILGDYPFINRNIA